MQEHFERTKHTYALELETQRVWDYTRDAYVHRLMTSKDDRKIVELTDADLETELANRVTSSTSLLLSMIITF